MFKFAVVLLLALVQKCWGFDHSLDIIKKQPTWSFKVESVETVIQKELSAFKNLYPAVSEDVLREKLARHVGPDTKYIVRKTWDPKWPKVVPPTFDLRDGFKNCAHLIGDTEDEGPCHTETPSVVASVAADRYCIFTNGTYKERFSTEMLAGCAESCTKSPSSYLSYKWMEQEGIPSGGGYHSKEGCVPYTYAPCEHGAADYLSESVNGEKLRRKRNKKKPCSDILTYDHDCPTKCTNEKYSKSLKDDTKKYTTIYYLSAQEYAIRAEMFIRGPASTSFILHEDFLHYKKGIYRTEPNSTVLAWDRYVKLIGWGTAEDGTKYWLAVNSWSDWGDKKTVQIPRGKNYLWIEWLITAGTYDPQ